MPDQRSHRGLHPQDAANFAPALLPVLQVAVEELAWLLSRGYAITSALKLVGDRHELRQRQREMIARAVCSDDQRQHRQQTRIAPAAVAGQEVLIDGFNLLITVEAAFSGGLVYKGRDGALRDLSSVHGSYRSVIETDAALHAIGVTLQALHPASVTWCFDQPVSNSGRLAQRLRDLALQQGWPWQVEVALNPDRELIARNHAILVSSDALILDHANRWLALSELVLQEHVPHFTWLDLAPKSC
jgi:hypothetical protein